MVANLYIFIFMIPVDLYLRAKRCTASVYKLYDYYATGQNDQLTCILLHCRLNAEVSQSHLNILQTVPRHVTMQRLKLLGSVPAYAAR